MMRPPEPAETPDDLPQTVTATRPLTPAHKALIAMLAKIAVEQYLAEEDEK